jgi:hypothetical protein
VRPAPRLEAITPDIFRQMRLRHASACDTRWLHEVVNRIGSAFGTRFDLDPDGTLALRRA